nr:MAG TPA: hypothetical protein [Caudoviricetes sp.]
MLRYYLEKDRTVHAYQRCGPGTVVKRKRPGR